MSKRVLVTGYGGFLGSEITRQLLAVGDCVVGFGRGDYPHLQALPFERTQFERIRGDIRNAQEIGRAVREVDAVIHTAAIAGVWGPWDLYHGINARGTQNIVDACLQHNVKVLVYCSSPSVTFDGTDQSGIDESTPYPSSWLCHYPHTKAIGEKAVLDAHQPGKLWTCALRPHLIWGAEDPHLFPRLIDRARRNRLRIVGSGQNRIDTVHVVNAAAAHVCAVDRLWDEANGKTESGAGGRAYFITQDEPVQCWDWIAEILKIAGVEMPTGRISFRAAWRLGHAMEFVYRTLRRKDEPPMTRFVAAQLAKDHYFDISAARNLLGYKPLVSNEQGLEELRAAWTAVRKNAPT